LKPFIKLILFGRKNITAKKGIIMITSQDFSHKCLEHLSKLMAQMDRQSIPKFADLLLDSRESGSTTFFLGNGGYLKKNCDLNIHIPTKVSDHGPATDFYILVCGLVGSYFRKKFLNA
jgi:hypothetical protein